MTEQSQKYQKYDTVCCIGITGPSSSPQTLIISVMTALRGGDKQAQLHSLNEGEQPLGWATAQILQSETNGLGFDDILQCMHIQIAWYQFGVNKDTEGKRQKHHKRENQIQS